MDYSNCTGVKLMKPIAEKQGCSYVPFGQMKLIHEVETKVKTTLGEGHTGVCYGLAVAWLEALHNSSDSSTFVKDVSDLENSATFYRSYCAYRHQETYKSLNSGVLSGENYGAKDKFFGVGAIQQNGILKDTNKSKEFAATSGGMDELAAWLCASLSERYFMLHIKGHTMAAIGSKAGQCSFFDPNAGIIYSMNKSKIAKSMLSFFSSQQIKNVYRFQGSDWLTAIKFK